MDCGMRPLRAISTSRLMRPCVGAALTAFLVASVGYPVWSGHGGKDLSQPFPCMHRHCGCRNATQCWRGCCCFTNQQKLAWAKANGVSPPDYVVAAAKQETGKPTQAACCSTKKSRSCHIAATESARRSPLTAVIEAMTCLGQIEQWVALGAIDIPHLEAWRLELPLCGEIAFARSAYSVEATPPAPPPPWL
jgi:hypothetical protein